MKNQLKLILGMTLFLALSCTKDEVQDILPEAVTLISPLKGQSCEEGINTIGDKSRVFFEWERAENAQIYDIVVTDLETGENYITYRDIYKTKKELELVHNHAYSWYVISRNSKGEKTAVSQTWNFFFVGEPQENYVPFPATILSPEFGETLATGTVSLEWEGSDPDGDDLTYTVYLDKVDGKQTPKTEYSNLSASSLDVQLDAGTYYWRIKSSDGTSSSFSPIYTLNIQ
ncbi:hypothetical protein [Flavobacterium daejeonense]|uniref:hypothetical protein n=1 Tax=Flavobacterium daejeonense TaxID=350893 RepID=UPI00047E9A8D|nr:hypothetical protein [Flavobacterium daejeonense]